MNVFKLVLFYRVFLEFVVIIDLFPIHVTLLNLYFSAYVYFPIGLVNITKCLLSTNPLTRGGLLSRQLKGAQMKEGPLK